MNEILLTLCSPLAQLRIEEDDYLERPDVSSRAIYIVGNYEGFICLCHILLYIANEAESSVEITTLPFIKNMTGLPIFVRSYFSEDNEWGKNGFIDKTDKNITWKLGEENAAQAASLIHGLGYSWEHLHFDAKEKTQLSLFMAIE